MNIKLTKSLKSIRQILNITTGLTIAFNLLATPLIAADPFRNNNPQPIGDKTEAAFKALFVEANYKQALDYIDEALLSEPNEPLAYAMKASLAYLTEDWGTLKTYATKTREMGEQLTASNPLRGNLYTAAGHFLEGGSALTEEGAVKATPQALAKLRQVFQYLDTAEKISPQDPELNLFKGYMDLILSVYLPFSEPSEAITRLQNYAAPGYLANRGIAVGQRNLKQYQQALQSIDSALKETPNNPEVHYLKAQILFSLKKYPEAKENFQLALAKPDQLPKNLVQQIYFEKCRNLNRIDNKPRNCDALRDKITETAGIWAPAELPSLD
ncbi:MAG TPA: Sll0314/Alr1548 family TPR repeat-containing protein [Halomicronema sp.]